MRIAIEIDLGHCTLSIRSSKFATVSQTQRLHVGFYVQTNIIAYLIVPGQTLGIQRFSYDFIPPSPYENRWIILRTMQLRGFWISLCLAYVLLATREQSGNLYEPQMILRNHPGYIIHNDNT